MAHATAVRGIHMWRMLQRCVGYTWRMGYSGVWDTHVAHANLSKHAHGCHVRATCHIYAMSRAHVAHIALVCG